MIIQIKKSEQVMQSFIQDLFDYMNGLVLENKTKSEMNTKNTTLNGHE